MATTLTRQDILAITETAKNNIVNRLVSKYDIQGATDNARDRILNTMNTMHIEDMAILRQMNIQSQQVLRKMPTIENQLSSIRNDLRLLTQAVNRLYEIEAQQLMARRSRVPDPHDQPAIMY